ncbi:hypothetical protein TorRG33x02_291810 [Trema orientale]|uniref:Uncharacterized protein n=1 Tax=Trema orientale TaxID=63057 RepID=A0A2P5CAX9_TREOI|nr:hypothetical protein TorRG33x02_291810 [Trema orientale]
MLVENDVIGSVAPFYDQSSHIAYKHEWVHHKDPLHSRVLTMLLFAQGLMGLESDEWAFNRRIAAQAFTIETFHPSEEFLLLSSSHLQRSKIHLADQLEMGDELVEPVGCTRWCKGMTSQLGLLGCALP